MPAERVLSQRELNRAMLARQLLLERSPGSIESVLEQMGGLQNQYAPSGYVGLWSRMADFPRDSLTRALEDRRVIQATLIRSTIHLVSAADYWLFAAGARRGRQEWWLRIQRHDAPAAVVEQAAAAVRSRLEVGPQRQADLIRTVEELGHSRMVWNAVGLWLDMVRVPPSGTWERRRADLYSLADAWLGPCTAGEREGIEHLVLRYLGGFGPAPVRDIANWAGIPVAAVRPTAERLDVRRFRDEEGRELVDLPEARLPDADIPAPVRFLPTWDAALLIHCRRTQVLPERFRPLVFNTKTPHSKPVFLVDGAVAGTWRYDKGRVELTPFEPLPATIRRELEDEAERLAAFHR
jgi:hypothetical protein